MGFRWLLIFFAILSVVFGCWGFAPSQPVAWASAQALFWMCLGIFLFLLVMGLIAWSGFGRTRPMS